MKKQFVLALFAFAAVSFASCTNDADLNGGKAPGLTEEKEGVGYMSFSLRSETRAEASVGNEKFDDGDVQEYALAGTLNSHVAIFFDATKKYFGYSYLTPKQALKDGPHGDPNADHNNNSEYATSEKLYTYITRDPRVSKNGQTPASVLLLLNVKPAHLVDIIESLGTTSTIEDVKNAIGTKDMYGIYKVNGLQYYTMTNSAFVDADNKLQLAADCSNKVSTSPEAAAANPVTVFVERVVAKHSLVFNTNDNSGVTLENLHSFVTPEANNADDSYNLTVSYVAEFVNETNTPEPETKTWKVHVVGWGANALERNTFLYKRLESVPGVMFSTAVDGFKDWWNVMYLHRSYWAIDPNYNNANTTDYTWATYSKHTYPTQYRPTYTTDNTVTSWTDKSIYNETGTDHEDGYWALDYVSYNEANSTAANVYSLENTFAYEAALKNFAPMRYGTHMLLTAQLVFENAAGDETEVDKDIVWKAGLIDEVADKLYADGYYWSKDAYLNWAFKHLSEFVANGVAHTSVKDVFGGADKSFGKAHDEALNTLYVKNGADYNPIVYTKVNEGDVLVSDVFELKKAYVKNGDGKVGLTLKDGDDIHVYYRLEDTENAEGETEVHYVELTKQDVVCLVQAVMPAAAKYYNKGCMYYAIPVKHYAIYNSTELGAAQYGDGGHLEDAEYELGDFGTVRNHWYRFNINTIKKPGTPVDDPNDPIIPNEPEEYDYLGVEIVVLPWHVIDQNVEL